jgi:hypothetical protein
MEELPTDVDRICIHCGKVVWSDRKLVCNNCGMSLPPKVDSYDALLAGHPPTIVRVYRGNQQSDVTPSFRKDADILAGRGYTPTTQSWAEGQWGGGAFLVALLLCVVLIGFVVFLYLLVVKPEGTLTVTYARQEVQPASVAPPTPSALAETVPANATLAERLRQLGEARDAGLISNEEFDAKRSELLRGL